jgi:WS/DGAT/MGAT family acyltransferase
VPILRKAKVQPLEAAPGTVELLSRALMANLTAPLRMAGPAFKVLPKLGMTVLKKVGGALTNQGPRVPKTRFNGAVSGSRVFDSVVLDLQTFKYIKAAVDGATVNDVVLTVVGGALRSYLQRHKALPKESLVTLSPVNTRADKGGGGGSGNSITFLTFALRTDIADPIERLRAVREETSQTKAMNQAVGARELTDLTRFAPPATLAFVGRLASIAGLGGAGPAPLHNTGISNVPGPTVPLYLLGARMTYLSCVTPIGTGMGLVHAVSSYDGRMIISPTSTPEMLPDAPFYATCIRDSVRQMHKAAQAHTTTAGTAPGSTRRRPTVKVRRTVQRAGRPATRARVTTKA